MKQRQDDTLRSNNQFGLQNSFIASEIKPPVKESSLRRYGNLEIELSLIFGTPPWGWAT